MKEKTVAAKTSVTKNHVAVLTICGVFIALTYICTYINIRLPIAANGGLVHLGNIPVFIAAAYFGKKVGAVAGGIGMALFDLLSGWTAWALFTLIIVSAIGFVFGLIVHEKIKFWRLLVACICACAIKIVGYYIAEGIIYGNWIAPAMSIPGNIVQIAVASIIAIPIIMGSKQIWGKGGSLHV